VARPVRSLLNPLLATLLIGLICAYAIVHHYLKWSWLNQNKDELAALNSLIGVAAILVGGVLAYYRFFRGRTFSTRAELAMKVDVLEIPTKGFLHVLTLSIKNVGTVSIWTPQPVVRVTAHREGTDDSVELVDNWYDATIGQGQSPRLSVLDSGESNDFFMHRTFSKDVWAVTYLATVGCSSGDSWTKLSTVENRVARAKET